jgi:cytochrome c oxidase subunit 1
MAPLQRLMFGAYLLGGLGVVLTFLYAGKESVPRRWAVHVPEWMGPDRLGSVFAALVVIATAAIAIHYLSRYARQS